MARQAAEARAAAAEAGARLERAEREFREELRLSRREAAAGEREFREELRAGLSLVTDALLKRMAEIARMQTDQLDSFSRLLSGLTGVNEAKLEALRQAVESRLGALQADSAAKLDQMRLVVDERLQATLEQRLGDSFRLVSERLERVAAGLGEMRALAAGVGDLKRVLTNIKTRGTWGEVRLGRILEEILAPEQYAANVATRPGSAERVEFAIRLPGQDPARGDPVWLPIDAKFPQEDYQRLLEVTDRKEAERALKSLEARIRAEAKAIRAKYVAPPHTTDFAILFLPVEGLYAEVLRIPGLCEALQRESRVVPAGPTTLAALLNSLQMGFRTLAIERRSSEVWELLAAVKSEFGRFGDTLAKTKRRLEQAAHSIDRAETRTRAIERRLRRVEEAAPTLASGPPGGVRPPAAP
jgi:DNA recombination protein RmuC